jgi:uncharacterized protein
MSVSTIVLRSAGASVLLMALAGTAGAQGRAADQPAPRTIHASGTSIVKSAPDRVRVMVSVISRAATAREASEANARTSKTVLEKLRAAVHDPGEVKTTGYELSPQYDYDQQRGGPTLTGYASTNRFAITSADLAGVGALIDSAVASGANQIDSIGFYLDDEAAVRRQALLEAGRKAREEAETIAQSLGTTLGELLDASTSASAPPVPVYARMAAMAEDMRAATPATEVVPGSIETSATVSVTFAIQ